jgi:asparaginyl-tRNA synthetase
VSLRGLQVIIEQSYPIQKKYQTPEFLRTLPHLRPRIPQNALLLRLRSQVVSSLTTFFDERGFVQVHTPIITSSDCEGAGEVFTIEAPRDATEIKSDQNSAKSELERPFFKTPKYLTVSSQLHLEALALAVKNVWTLSPTFRAEKSDTARHLSEFYMLEAEMAFVESAGEVMDVIEDMIKFLTSRLADSKLGQELLLGRKSNSPRGATDSLDDTLHSEDLQNRWEKVLHPSWPRITYHEACLQITEAAKSNAAQFDVIPNETSGLDTEHERYIAAAAGQGGPVFVTDYPRSIKPFYMAPSKHRPIEEIGSVPTVACWDLLMPDVCEVVGGSMREHRLEELQRAMAQKGLAVDSQSQAEGEQGMTELNAEGDTYDAGLEWYLDLRRYGSVPHGGWGLGFDRLLGFLAGVSNIRDVVTFPRYHKKCLC